MVKTVLVPPVPNSDITAAARESLKGKFGKCALFGFVLFISEAILSSIVDISPLSTAKYFANGVITAVCSTILGLAYFKFCGRIADDEEEPDFKLCIDYSLKRFAIATIAAWYAGLIIFLKLLLLIIPGILAAFDYAMVVYIVFDDPDIRIGDALKRSRRLMYGHRWQFFCLSWRFVGWGLLCLLTCGIGFLWLAPYATTSCWKFYRSITPAPESPEAEELPELKPYSGMPLTWRIFWFIFIILLSSAQDFISDKKADRLANSIVNAIERADAKAQTGADATATEQP